MLQRAIKNEKVINSYLFWGMKDRKKHVLSSLQKCSTVSNRVDAGDACDHCTSCKRLITAFIPTFCSLNQRDRISRSPDKTTAKDLAYRPYEGKRRVCILTAADRMAPHIPNTLLKTLEEPPLHTVIICWLITPGSYCPQSFHGASRFASIPAHPLVSKWLMEGYGFDEAEAHLLASFQKEVPERLWRSKRRSVRFQEKNS